MSEQPWQLSVNPFINTSEQAVNMINEGDTDRALIPLLLIDPLPFQTWTSHKIEIEFERSKWNTPYKGK